ncbi:MAG: transposase, partial [Candidatus Poribacteria bacterium]
NLEGFCDDRYGILSPIMKSLKGYTGKEANRLLNRHGSFWQEESYNHWVRDEDEFRRIVYYIENNPVKARLVSQPHDWLYSSAYVRRKFHLDFFEPLDQLRSEFVQQRKSPDLRE